MAGSGWDVVGSVGWVQDQDAGGDALHEFAQEHHMPVLNTFHGEDDHWTWESTHGLRHRIDYILTGSWIANHALTSDAIHTLDKQGCSYA